MPISSPVRLTGKPVKLQLASNDQSDSNSDTNAKADQYRLKGRGSSARIVDSFGETIIQSGSKSGIYISGSQVSPDGKQIYVESAESEDFILDPVSRRKVYLPFYPSASAEGPMGVLESWHWVDDKTLIAKASEWKPKEHSTKFGLEDEANILRTRLYLYNVSAATLVEIQMPTSFTMTTFDISGVTRDGKICLVSPAVGSDGNLGCFKLESN